MSMAAFIFGLGPGRWIELAVVAAAAAAAAAAISAPLRWGARRRAIEDSPRFSDDLVT